MASKEQRIQDGLEQVADLLEQVETTIQEMPIRGKVKDIMIRKLMEWNDELNDVVDLSPSDW